MELSNKKQVFNISSNKLGKGDVKFCWQPGCRWLALVGDTNVILIVDRLGKIIVEFQIKTYGKVKTMEFDSDGDTLAIFQENCSIVKIINIHSKKEFDMEIDRSNGDKPTTIKWAKKDPCLAICTEKGLIYIYNKQTSKLIPCGLTHSDGIISCDWNDECNLITAGKDYCIGVTNRSGNSIVSGVKFKSVPFKTRWSYMKSIEGNSANSTISCILNNNYIFIYDTSKKNKSLELHIKENYGQIINYSWYGDGYIAVAFSKGIVSILSTHKDEIKNEVHSFKAFETGIDDIATCDDVSRIAVAAENYVKIYNSNTFQEYTEEKIDIPFDAGRIIKIEWSNSGNILIVSTNQGNIFAFNVVVNDSYAVYSKILFNFRKLILFIMVIK